MRNRNKIDPSVAKIMRSSAKQPNQKIVDVRLTIGDSRKPGSTLIQKSVRPQNHAEFIRIQRNLPVDEEKYPSAFSGKIVNSPEGLYLELALDGKVLCYDVSQDHRFTGKRNTDYVWLRINGRCVERVYSDEGIQKLIG